YMLKPLILACALTTSTLGAEKNVLAFAGSTRENSSNIQLVTEAAEIAKQMGAKVTVVNLKDFPMPFYDADLEAKEQLPPKAKELRQLMIQNDVIFIASPEYNSSVSGILKNTIDWLSRNEKGEGSREAFKGKKFMIMSASPGSTGGARGLVHLEAIISNIGGEVIPLKISVKNSYEAFDEKGQLKDSEVRKQLQEAVKSAISTTN
ncbi:MAG: NAD(P)H-dependent oxidoreductase, partial [Parachlamydiaceae bacterium]|nr:NAD(P)H-dependent oxidoreductase [Parachlamydiaceae bacterium]